MRIADPWSLELNRPTYLRVHPPTCDRFCGPQLPSSIDTDVALRHPLADVSCLSGRPFDLDADWQLMRKTEEGVSFQNFEVHSPFSCDPEQIQCKSNELGFCVSAAVVEISVGY